MVSVNIMLITYPTERYRNVIIVQGQINQSFCKNVSESLPQKPKLLKSHTYTVMSARGANLGPIG